MGGALPLRSLLAAVFGPPERGCHGHPGSTADEGSPSLWVPWEPWAKGWPQGPMAPPLAGGGRCTRERLAGVNIYPGVPW